MFTIEQLRAEATALRTEATAELCAAAHAFINWLEGKQTPAAAAEPPPEQMTLDDAVATTTTTEHADIAAVAAPATDSDIPADPNPA